MSDYNTDYKFSPKVRAIIEARMGAKMGLTHAQAEMLIKDVFRDKYKGDYKFKDEDKKKIMFYLSNFDPNSYDKEQLEIFSKFLLNVFTKDEVIKFVTYVVNGYYHPGMVLYQIRVYNTLVTYFVSLFPDYFPMLKGIIINSKFVGDVKKIYSEVKFNEDTAEIEDELVDEKINQFVKELKDLHRRKLRIFHKDNIYVLASKNDMVIDDISKFNLNVEEIPEFYFNWEPNGKKFYFI